MKSNPRISFTTANSRPALEGLCAFRLFLLCAFALLPIRGVAAQVAELREEDKLFYALGLTLARSVFNFELTAAELNVVTQGLTDGVLGNPRRVKLLDYSPRLGTLAKQRMAASYAKNTALGLELLARAAIEPNSTRTESGLVQKTIREGSGPAVEDSVTVRAIVRQRLPGGTVVGDQDLESEPIVVSLNRAFPCWKEGMSNMRVGGRSLLSCPASLTYGERDGPFGTRPGSVLVFDVEILEIISPQQTKTPSRRP
jgi:FKBP-type peptidyl-prolyl cis-trans isomerase